MNDGDVNDGNGNDGRHRRRQLPPGKQADWTCFSNKSYNQSVFSRGSRASARKSNFFTVGSNAAASGPESSQTINHADCQRSESSTTRRVSVVVLRTGHAKKRDMSRQKACHVVLRTTTLTRVKLFVEQLHSRDMFRRIRGGPLPATPPGG